MDFDNKTTRRGFLDVLIGFCSAITGAALAFPAFAFLWPAAKGGATDNVEVDGAAAMQPGDSKMLQVGGRAVIVVRQRAEFVAFSAVCTHLGCLVKWDGAGKKFLCPCHAAVFDDKGAVVSGPPPAPLPPYKVKTVGDKVYVSPA
jgi:cytochrome b6-f complex iron-sulfur subunit